MKHPRQRSSPGQAARGAMLLLALAAASSPAGAGDWTMFRGDPQQSGVAHGGLARELEPRWTYRAGTAIESTAVIHAGRVFVATLDGELHAVSLADGTLEWKYAAADAIRSSPSVWKGTVYFGDEKGVFHAVDARDGRRRWIYETEAGIVSSANFAGDRVLFGSYDNRIYALSTADGALQWSLETEGYVHATPAVWEGNGGPAIVSAGCDGFLRVIAVRDGSELRRIPLGGYVASSPAVRGDHAYLGSFENQVLAVDLQRGVVQWTYEPQDRKFPFYSSAAVSGDIVVIGGRDKRVHALRAAAGEALWAWSSRGRIDASPVIVGGLVYAAAGSGEIVALDLHSGGEVWRFDSGASFAASPAIGAGRLVIGTTDGVVYCFGARS